MLLYVLSSLMCLSAMSTGVAGACGASDETLARLRAARALHDPALPACVGLLILAHVHDSQQIALYFHTWFGGARTSNPTPYMYSPGSKRVSLACCGTSHLRCFAQVS